MPDALSRLESSGVLKDPDFNQFLFHFYDACSFMHCRIEHFLQSGEGEDSPEVIDAQMYACLFHALLEMEGHDRGNPVFVKVSSIIEENDDVLAFLWVGFQCFTFYARTSVKSK